MTEGPLLYRAAAAACAASGVAGVAAWVRGLGRASRSIAAATGVSLGAYTTVVWVLRWREAGHLPIFGMYESALSLAVAVLLTGVAWDGRSGFRAGVTPVAALVSAALLAHGLRFNPAPLALTISERSWAVDVHAFAAWAAFGTLAANAALAVSALARRSGRPVEEAWLARTLEIGFVLHTGMMVSGSFYKFLLFGSAWTFDPIETLGFATWISYGTLVHMSLFAGWRGRRLAGWSLFLFALLVVSYRLIVYFPAWSTYHIFDIDLRLHLPR